MKATAKVTVQLGQVPIPNCKLFKAIESGEKVSLNNLHVDCLNKINEIVKCFSCGKEIVDKKVELIKGYPNPLSKDKWVTLTAEEIDSCRREASDIVRVIQFVEPADLCPIYYSSAYYLTAEKDGLAPLSLFYYALKQSGLIALAKMISRGKDHFLAMEPYESVIIAYDLHFPAEIRNTEELESVMPADSFDQETMGLILSLLRKMTKPLDTSIIVDEYNDGLRKIIMAKAKGERVDTEEKKVTRKVISLKDALKGSLAA